MKYKIFVIYFGQYGYLFEHMLKDNESVLFTHYYKDPNRKESFICYSKIIINKIIRSQQ